MITGSFPHQFAAKLTLPSAQSTISWSGSLARYIDVVLHHIGNPRNMTTAQNEKMTRVRMRMLSCDSGGGALPSPGYRLIGLAASSVSDGNGFSISEAALFFSLAGIETAEL